jgi:hypothetical protein
MQACDAIIRAEGRGCCGQCFETDPHGLLDKFKVIDVADQQQEIQNLTRVAAQAVIAFGEHAKEIRRLRAESSGHVEEIALLRGRLSALEAGEERADATVKQRLLVEVMTEVRKVVQALPERVQEVEECIIALEKKLKLTRRPKGQRG